MHLEEMVSLIVLSLWSFLILAVPTSAQSSSVVSNGFSVPPFQAEVWADNVTGARGLVVDAEGDVLVVAKGLGGIYAFWVEADGQVSRTRVVSNSNLNHGIAIYGNHLYASSSSTVWRWRYQAGQRSAATEQQAVVVNINQNDRGLQTNDGHQTRSLAIGTDRILYVSVGSLSNVDADSFRARIRSFDLSSIPSEGFDFVRDGVVFADGLRNAVGLGFDGKGQLWGVENGPDELRRADLGGDIHDDNPADELNLFSNETAGAFYGFPFCWSEYDLLEFGTGPGSQWAWPELQNATITDAWCKNRSNVRPPELAMQAHTAPLGVAFYDGTNCGNLIRNATDDRNASYSLPCEFTGDAFVAFHGSWNRDTPVGYKVVRIAFDNGTGLPASRNDSSIFDVFGAVNSETACTGDPGQPSCLRPVDVKFDNSGALLVTSDATGEIFRISSSNITGTAAPTPAAAPSSAPSLGSRDKILLRAFAPLLLCLWWHSASFHEF